MSVICVHCVVSGIVQGVFYRLNTQQKATNLGLTGWVKNTPDGKVELVACGEEKHIQTLCDWLWQGPPAAKVSHVKIEPQAWEEHKGFVVR